VIVNKHLPKAKRGVGARLLKKTGLGNLGEESDRPFSRGGPGAFGHFDPGKVVVRSVKGVGKGIESEPRRNTIESKSVILHGI